MSSLGTAANRELAICSEKQRLIDALLDVHARLLDLGHQEVSGVKRGDATQVAALQQPMERARLQRDNVLVLLRTHVKEHRC